jgi:hypothetical protein
MLHYQLHSPIIFEKVQDMYFSNPPIEPDLETYKDIMKVLIKWDDR